MDSNPATPRDYVDLMELPAGTFVEVRTKSGSTYWIATMTHRYRVEPGGMIGIMVTTNSASADVVQRQSPYDTISGADIHVGERWVYGGGRRTSEVTSIEVTL